MYTRGQSTPNCMGRVPGGYAVNMGSGLVIGHDGRIRGVELV
jgi:hypothetical protein